MSHYDQPSTPSIPVPTNEDIGTLVARHPSIITQERKSDWIAFLNDSWQWGIGSTEAEAIQNALLSQQEKIDLTQQRCYQVLFDFIRSLILCGYDPKDALKIGFDFAMGLQVGDLDNPTIIKQMTQARDWVELVSTKLRISKAHQDLYDLQQMIKKDNAKEQIL